jgi:ArsR family transcriptional regulator, arsenate/arsenite/antimonite-responsive transcriptional repressor
MTVDATASPPAPEAACCLPRRIPAGDRARAAAVSGAAKALADPIRVEILTLLRDAESEVCQCELQPLFDISQPTLSHHLKKLAAAELITVRRRGKWAYYSINDQPLEVLRQWVS